jgi:hypothetical protein
MCFVTASLKTDRVGHGEDVREGLRVELLDDLQRRKTVSLVWEDYSDTSGERTAT